MSAAAEGLRTPRDEHDQPLPQTSDRPAIQDLVIADIVERKLVGIRRYGTVLQAHNGRNALLDLYQELLDGVMYVKQVMEEGRSAARRLGPAQWSGERLQQQRVAAGLTQAALAERVGKTEAAIRSYERGDRRPSVEVVGLLADACDCSIDLFYATVA